MPELPEVETIRQTIWPRLAGRTIDRVEITHPDVVQGWDPAFFAAALAGRRFVTADRRGKYIIFGLAGASAGMPGPARPAAPLLHVLVHLRMTGRLGCVERGAEAPPHTHLRLELDDGTDVLFTDTRRFGRWTLLDCPAGVGAAIAEGPVAQPAAGGPRGFRELGPEPLSPALTEAAFAAGLASRRGKLKAVLLDQCFVAGIGNIYADEIMHRARVHPLRAANSLSSAEAGRLYAAMRAVLSEAIGKGGTTIRDYVDGRGRKGDFVYSLRVYGRTGEPCTEPGCGGTIERIVVAGRSTHFCPRCQQAPVDSKPE